MCRPVRVVDNEVPWGNNSQRVKGKASELAAMLLSEDRVVNVDEQADLIQHNEWNTQVINDCAVVEFSWQSCTKLPLHAR